jgi:hypothetical protein
VAQAASNSVPTGIKGAALGLLVMAMGGFIVCVGLGVVPVPEESIHAPRWVIAAAGLAFLLAGVSVVQQAFRIEALKYVPGTVASLALVAIANWVAFGSGDRSGEGTLDVGGFQIPVSSDIGGRIVFVFVAVAIDLLFVVGFIHWFRSKFRTGRETKSGSETPRRGTRESMRAKQRPGPRRDTTTSAAR